MGHCDNSKKEDSQAQIQEKPMDVIEIIEKKLEHEELYSVMGCNAASAQCELS